MVFLIATIAFIASVAHHYRPPVRRFVTALHSFIVHSHCVHGMQLRMASMDTIQTETSCDDCRILAPADGCAKVDRVPQIRPYGVITYPNVPWADQRFVAVELDAYGLRASYVFIPLCQPLMSSGY